VTHPLKIADSSRGLSAIAELLVHFRFRNELANIVGSRGRCCSSLLFI